MFKPFRKALNMVEKIVKNMRKLFFIQIFIQCFCITNLNAQIFNKEDLKKFYIQYCSYAFDDSKLDSLFTIYCTEPLRKELNKEIINGLYDSFTEGYCDDYEVVKNTLSVEKKNDYYVVSFYFETWPEKKKKDINVIIYVDKNGLISHIKRPSDGLMIPEK